MAARRTTRGQLKRRCRVCGRSHFWVAAALEPLSLRNRCDADLRVDVAVGVLVCHRCAEHNDAWAKVDPLPVSTSTKTCPRCEGRRKVPAIGVLKRGNGFLNRGLELCLHCNGEGRVAA